MKNKIGLVDVVQSPDLTVSDLGYLEYVFIPAKRRCQRIIQEEITPNLKVPMKKDLTRGHRWLGGNLLKSKPRYRLKKP